MQIKKAIEEVKTLNFEDFKEFGDELGKNLVASQSEYVIESLSNRLSSDDKKRVLVKSATNMSDDDKRDLFETIGVPSLETRDNLWKIVIWAFAAVMAGSFCVLAIGVFVDKPQDPIASSDILLSIFTAAVGFFAGLFAPSPKAK